MEGITQRNANALQVRESRNLTRLPGGWSSRGNVEALYSVSRPSGLMAADRACAAMGGYRRPQMPHLESAARSIGI